MILLHFTLWHYIYREKKALQSDSIHLSQFNIKTQSPLHILLAQVIGVGFSPRGELLITFTVCQSKRNGERETLFFSLSCLPPRTKALVTRCARCFAGAKVAWVFDPVRVRVPAPRTMLSAARRRTRRSHDSNFPKCALFSRGLARLSLLCSFNDRDDDIFVLLPLNLLLGRSLS